MEFRPWYTPLFQLDIEVPVELDEVVIRVVDEADLAGGAVSDKVLVDSEEEVAVLLYELFFVWRLG